MSVNHLEKCPCCRHQPGETNYPEETNYPVEEYKENERQHIVRNYLRAGYPEWFHILEV
jgi:hypothetical protein